MNYESKFTEFKNCVVFSVGHSGCESICGCIEMAKRHASSTCSSDEKCSCQ